MVALIRFLLFAAAHVSSNNRGGVCIMAEEQMDFTVETVNSVKISADVVGTIAALATSGIPGVAGMSGGIADGIAQMLGRKQLTKGVKVEVTDNDCSVDISIVVEYGCNIPAVAGAIQESVKTAISDMTGINVTAININVQGVSFPQEEAAAEEAEVEVLPAAE